MTAHYSGNDPERGCGLMIAAAVGIVIFLLLLALLSTLIPELVQRTLEVLP